MAQKKVDKRMLRHIRTRKRLWPKLNENVVWNWKESDGFATIPRTLPYFYKIMDDLSKSKPVSSTYFALWSRLWDPSGLIKINNSLMLALESGFSGQRAVTTWRSRMKILEKLGFIKTKPLGLEPYGYVLLVNPYYVVKKLHDSNKYTDEGWYNALWERAEEIKATDLEEFDDDFKDEN
jgi:hypothetical protein